MLKLTSPDISQVHQHVLSEALYSAIEHDKYDEITNLILKKVDVNATKKNFEGYYTPLMFAIDKQRYDIVDLLLEAGANPNTQDFSIRFNETLTPLMLCAFYYDRKGIDDVIKSLVIHGADLNHVSEFKFTPLSLSVMKNAANIVQLLIELDADLNIGENGYRDAMFVAKAYEYPELAALIEKTSLQMTATDQPSIAVEEAEIGSAKVRQRL